MNDPNEPIPSLRTDELEQRLADLLVKGSLYEELWYSVKKGVGSLQWRSKRFQTLPETITMYCNDRDCNRETLWGTSKGWVVLGMSEFYAAHYVCRGCGRNLQYYWIKWSVFQQGVTLFTKVGQFPPPSTDPP